jgi:hypothetical protein
MTGVVAAHAFDLRAEKKVYALPDASRCGEITDCDFVCSDTRTLHVEMKTENPKDDMVVIQG